MCPTEPITYWWNVADSSQRMGFAEPAQAEKRRAGRRTNPLGEGAGGPALTWAGLGGGVLSSLEGHAEVIEARAAGGSSHITQK